MGQGPYGNLIQRKRGIGLALKIRKFPFIASPVMNKNLEKHPEKFKFLKTSRTKSKLSRSYSNSCLQPKNQKYVIETTG